MTFRFVFLSRLFIFFLASGPFVPARVGATSSEDLWREYRADPNNHAALPNNSFAGYQYGEVQPPVLPVVANVVDFGALPNDGNPDDVAFRKALNAAYMAGGGAVAVPAGTWTLADPLWIHQSGVVVRGAGPDQTRLQFTRPLLESVGNENPSGTNIWAWTGGLVWIGPRDAVVRYAGEGEKGTDAVIITSTAP